MRQLTRSILSVILVLAAVSPMDAQSLKSVIEEQAKEAGLSIEQAEDDWVIFSLPTTDSVSVC